MFRLTRRESRSPRTGNLHRFDVIESSDWVNIVPLTANDEVVLITQYRHGIEAMTLEIPGGMIDPGEAPLTAARREMQEETGYDSDDIVRLGAIHPNPAIQDNRCHMFLARNVVPKFETHFDTTEETLVQLVPLANIPQAIRDGSITHALVVAAFHWLGLQNLR